MIKFFRKIRQNLLAANKTRTYFKYAIGEIVLVVIGILIALSINNWNQNNAEKKALKTLTDNLNKEFKNNLEELEVDLNRLRMKIVSGNKLLTYCGPDKIVLSEFEVDSLLYQALEVPTWNPSTFTLNEIKNSGKLSKIKDENLKLLLYHWERLYEDILEWQMALQASNEGPLGIIKAKGSIVNVDFYNDATHETKFKLSNVTLLQDVAFENELENNLFNARSLVQRYQEAKVLLTKIHERSKSETSN